MKKRDTGVDVPTHCVFVLVGQTLHLAKDLDIPSATAKKKIRGFRMKRQPEYVDLVHLYCDSALTYDVMSVRDYQKKYDVLTRVIAEQQNFKTFNDMAAHFKTFCLE